MTHGNGNMEALLHSAPAALGTAPYEIEVVEELDELRDLRTEWEEVVPPKHGAPWQSFGWVEASAHSFGKAHPLRITTLRSRGRLVAAAAMVLKRSAQPLHPLRLDILGGEELKEPNGFLWRDSAALGTLVDAIALERVYPIRLSRIPADRSLVSDLVARFKRAGWITTTRNMPYPRLALQGEPIGKSLREDLRRARRKAERRGPVGLELVSGGSEDQLRSSIQRALEIHASGWRGRNGTDILSDPASARFFHRYGLSAARDGTLRLSFLTVGGHPVAVHFGIESAEGYWLLFIGYDEDYRECSPGNLLTAETVQDAARRGLSRYNFLGKEEPWIKRWTSDVEDCLVLAAYRPNVHSIRAVLSDALYLMNNRRKAEQVRRAKMGIGREKES